MKEIRKIEICSLYPSLLLPFAPLLFPTSSFFLLSSFTNGRNQTGAQKKKKIIKNFVGQPANPWTLGNFHLWSRTCAHSLLLDSSCEWNLDGLGRFVDWVLPRDSTLGSHPPCLWLCVGGLGFVFIVVFFKKKKKKKKNDVVGSLSTTEPKATSALEPVKENKVEAGSGEDQVTSKIEEEKATSTVAGDKVETGGSESSSSSMVSYLLVVVFLAGSASLAVWKMGGWQNTKLTLSQLFKRGLAAADSRGNYAGLPR
ncbi:hypothetical protein IE53DRAFT_97432 [Violaceomyces palustris]|uniref:Uncharacterized protein n=1 Tax=Violaceomyces palustris TaxID=1673888 RepID=A0ACD0NX46_9BASI|nr:hypothetical protein IE53DRAFT_97432 [Violaceomyces palustris]